MYCEFHIINNFQLRIWSTQKRVVAATAANAMADVSRLDAPSLFTWKGRAESVFAFVKVILNPHIPLIYCNLGLS